MFKLKSVVFIVLIFTICSVFGKNHKLRNHLSLRKQNQNDPNPKVASAPLQNANTPPMQNPNTAPLQNPNTPPMQDPNTPPMQDPNTPQNDAAANALKSVSDEVFFGADISDDNTPFDVEVQHFKDLYLSSIGEYPEEYYYYYDEAEDPVDPYNAFNDFVDSELQAVDSDSNGEVTYDEYLVRLGEIADRYNIPRDVVSDDQLKEVFDYFNKNEDDILDRDEFAELVQAVLELLVGHFDYINGTPLEKLFNLQEYIQLIKYYLPEPKDDADTNSDDDQAEPEFDSLDWLYELTKYIKYADDEDTKPEDQVVTLEDARNSLDYFILNYVQANDKLKQAVTTDLQGDKVIDQHEFHDLLKHAIEKLIDIFQRQVDAIKEKEAELIEEEFNQDGDDSFLKLKSHKKSRKMKKNLKTDLSKKTKKVKKMRSKKSKKVALKK